MKRLVLGLFLIPFLVLSAAVGAADEPKSPGAPERRAAAEGKMESVITVLKVTVQPVKGSPGQLKIAAVGEANSVAKDAELRPRGVKDGVAEFDFVAKLPPGMMTMMMGQITAQHVFAPPQGVREIRIHAKSNAVTERVP